jgi:hypothetical protein
MKRWQIFLGALAILLAMLACRVSPAEPRTLNLYPSETPDATQTAVVVRITVPVIVQITNTPEPTGEPVVLCVVAQTAVHLRPSPSNDNYPIEALKNGSRLTDLGGRDGAWLFVRVGTTEGWVHGDFVQEC